MFFRKMQLTDFLSIKGTLAVDIDKRVTIVLGSNDHGKTNLLVAMQHINEHQPILTEEANWDSTSEPRLDYEFEFSEDERRLWRQLIHAHLAALESATDPTKADKDAALETN